MCFDGNADLIHRSVQSLKNFFTCKTEMVSNNVLGGCCADLWLETLVAH